MHIKLKITGILVLLFISLSAATCHASQITDSDFIKADGSVLRADYGTGAKVVLRGVNAGGWLVQEPWMTPTGYDTADQLTIESTLISRFGETAAEELLDVYLDSYWTEEDFDNCSELGMNVIRLPFWYKNIVDDDGNLRDDAFDRLDWFVEEAGERGIYVILDMHGAPGSQNGEVHSGDTSGLGLWTGVDVAYNQSLFVKIWEYVAEHYEGNATVAGYDLLNESYCSEGSYTNSEVWDLYDRAYDAIRDIDGDHLIIMASTWEYYNLPDPDDYGWENVMYEYHQYNYDDQLDSDAQLTSLTNKITSIASSGYDVPSYIGETSFFANMESWEKCLSALNDSGISWTIWSYKVTGDGTNSWGVYNMNIDSASLTTDSYDDIKAKWEASATDSAYANTELLEIVKEYVSSTSTSIVISNATVSSISVQYYTGSAIKPSLTVKYSGTTLKEGTDYTLSYSDNVECGTATITITGIGDFDGKKTVTFKIVPEAVKKFTTSKNKLKSVTLKWNKNYNAEGYYVYQYKDGTWEQIAKLKSYYTSLKVGKLKAGTTYRFMIEGYCTIDGVEYSGDLSYLTTYTKVSRVKKVKAKIKKNKIKISWKKPKGAKGYEVYVKSGKKFKKVKVIKKGSKKSYVYMAKKAGTYKIKIRAYNVINGKKTYGKFSKIRTVKKK